jgi:methylated-DNA-[protein]-cysteine S-methyltransferase
VTVAYASLNGPVGWVSVFLEDGAVVALDWGRTGRTAPGEGLDAAVAELERYFEGASGSFNVPLRPAGGPFRRRVWERLAAIAWGATATYGALAVELGTAPRAVAAACAANPIPIIIPCHRVVAASGGLGGYSGGEGIVTKQALLALEGAAVPPAPRPAPFTERPHADERGG